MSTHSFGPLQAVVDAERRRGNPARLVVHDYQGLRGDPPSGHLKYPMDREAVLAEFDLGDRFRWVGSERDGLSGLRDEALDICLYDGRGARGWFGRRALARWWREWQQGPGRRRPLAEEEVQDG